MSTPLRNRIRVDLDAPVDEVWALVGDLARFPEYSAGLQRVDATLDGAGRCVAYLCHFRPMTDGGDVVLHRESVPWFEPRVGWASVGEPGNAFGLIDNLTLVTLEPSAGGTLLTWDEYFDALDVGAGRFAFDVALADIARSLVERFGGRLVVRFVDGPGAAAGA